ncbi:PIN domain-containing protein [Candidatus Woesearchaeota archaeon]|nr:PIN domain-containing protein [Candidatus Woesearchaeota archaeon]
MIESKFIDSSVWLEYFFNNKHLEIFDSSEVLFVSVLSLFEIERKLRREKIESKKIITALEFIKRKCIIVPISTEIAEKAVSSSLEFNIPAVDSLIYSSAKKCKAQFFTCDNDFRGLENVTILH